MSHCLNLWPPIHFTYRSHCFRLNSWTNFIFYLATDLPSLNCLADLYFLFYQHKLKFVQSCLDSMNWTIFWVFFSFHFFFSFSFLYPLFFFFSSFLWNQLNIELYEQYEICKIWDTQSPWDPINYRTQTHGITCTMCTHCHMYTAPPIQCVHTTTCTLHHMHDMYTKPHIHSATCMTCTQHHLHTTPHTHNKICRIMHTTPYSHNTAYPSCIQ